MRTTSGCRHGGKDTVADNGSCRFNKPGRQLFGSRLGKSTKFDIEDGAEQWRDGLDWTSNLISRVSRT